MCEKNKFTRIERIKVRSHYATANAFFLSSQLDYMATS